MIGQNKIQRNGRYLMVVRPSSRKILLYIIIAMDFVVAGLALLLVPASKIHPTFMNPEPPAIVRIYGIVSLALGLIVIVAILKLRNKVVAYLTDSEIIYPRENYSISLEDIKSIDCYQCTREKDPYGAMVEVESRFIGVRLKNPEKYADAAPVISRVGAEMLKSDLYLNFAVASDRSFRKFCNRLKDLGIEMKYKACSNQTLKKLCARHGCWKGFKIWLKEVSENAWFAAAVLSLMVIGFILIFIYNPFV